MPIKGKRSLTFRASALRQRETRLFYNILIFKAIIDYILYSWGFTFTSVQTNFDQALGKYRSGRNAFVIPATSLKGFPSSAYYNIEDVTNNCI